ncbi:uncharacterized protein TRIVIDRAFT_10464, partial [Trichoderma virens Gv29-8]
ASRPSTSLSPAESSASTPSPVVEITSSETLPSTPAPEEISYTPVLPLNLWNEVFDRANDETRRWIENHGLKSTWMELSQPGDQIKELITLLETKAPNEGKYMTAKIQSGKHKIFFRTYFTQVVKFLTLAGDVAIAFAPPQASAPWAAAKIPLMQVDQMAALAGTIQWFTRTVRRGQLYEFLYNTTTTDEQIVSNLNDALRDLYIAAVELLARSDELFEMGKVHQTLNAVLRPEQVSGLISDLLKKEQKVLLEVQGCEASRNARAGKKLDQRIEDALKLLDEMSTHVTRIDEGVTKLLEEAEINRLDSFMNIISSGQTGKSHAEIRRSRTKNTGDWLINHEDFRDWQAIPSSSTLLCLKGTVGTGKTFLASRVIDYVKENTETSAQDRGFAFCYCDRAGSLMQDPFKVLRSLARQLSYKAYNDDQVRKQVVQICQSAREGWDPGYEEYEELILRSLNSYSRTIIILDALDESDITKYNLAETLIGLMEKASKPVKVFISSRPDREYLEAFKTESTITVDSSNQQGDIEKFLDKELYSRPFFTNQNGEIQKLIRETFASRNGGMFRWVHLQVQWLLKCILDIEIKLWATRLPPDLKGAYDQIWNSIKEQHGEHDIALAERAIQWVLCSFEPLKSETLLEAIRYTFEGDTLEKKEKQSEQQILSLCQDLLTIDSERQVWMIPHASVAEYFESKGMPLGICDMLVAKTCLNFLMRFEWNISQPRYDMEVLSADFEEYVAYTWFKHVERYEKWLGLRGGADPDAKLVATLKRFLGLPDESSDYYRTWVDKLNPSWIDRKFLMPSSMPVYANCLYGFYHVLRDWWEKDKITAEMVTKRTAWGNNALSLAACNQHMPMCRSLLSALDKTNHLTEEHINKALFLAIGTSNKDIISLLVMEGKADVNSYYVADNMDPPIPALMMRRPDVLQWLVDQKWVDIISEGGYAGNVLIVAAGSKNPRSVEILLKAGADANAAVECGYAGSALVAAILVHNDWTAKTTEIIQLLVDNGADPSLPLKVGDYGSALERMMTVNRINFPFEHMARYKDVLEIMLRPGVDPAIMLDRGEHGSALAAAAYWGLKDLLAMMIDVTGKDRAIKCLEQSRHPKIKHLSAVENFEKWKQFA